VTGTCSEHVHKEHEGWLIGPQESSLSLWGFNQLCPILEQTNKLKGNPKIFNEK